MPSAFSKKPYHNPKIRLDKFLVERKDFDVLPKAQSAIMAGIVFVDGQKIDKAGVLINPEAKVEVRGETCPYVSRGGLKLEGAIKQLTINNLPAGRQGEQLTIKNKVCLDVGVSTGGFTDYLLQNGAKKVYAVDVGYGQLDWKIRQDPRVIVIERTNARYLTKQALMPGFPDTLEPIELCVMDVSFISILKILPALKKVLSPGAEIVSLVKPQFEAKKEQVEKGGIVKDPKVHQEVLEKIKKGSSDQGFKVAGVCESPIIGADGNKEFFVLILFPGDN